MKKNIAVSTLTIIVAQIVIKLFGIIKQSSIASICGATITTDAYFLATGITTNLCVMVFSALSISLQTTYTKRLVLQGRVDSNNLINVVLRFYILFSSCITAVFFFFSSSIARMLAPSYTSVQLDEFADYIRILSVMYILVCYAQILNVVLETEKLFLYGKGKELFQNVFIVVALMFIYNKIGIRALLYAIILAGIFHCTLITITASKRKLFWFKLRCFSESKEIKRLALSSMPLILGNAIYEINDLVDKQISTYLGEGNVSVLLYGASINEIVTTVIITSISTVMFSYCSKWISEGKKEKLEETLKFVLECSLFVILPAAIMCFVCGDCIVWIIYGRGKFGADTIMQTNSVVVGYAIGFFFNAVRAIVVKVYYALGDTRAPMLNGVISVCINICMSITLSKLMGVAGIALATSVAMFIGALLLLYGIRRHFPGFSIKDSVVEYTKCIVSALITGIIACCVRNCMKVSMLPALIIVACVTAICYSILALLLKIKVMVIVREKLCKIKK